METRNKRKFKKWGSLSLALLLIVLLLLAGTFAWTDFTQHKTNRVKRVAREAFVTLNDSFNPKTAWVNSDTASKQVSVSSTAQSENPVIVRLQFKEFMKTYDVVKAPIESGGKPVYFATWASGPNKGEYMTAAEANTLFGASNPYGTETVDGVAYATTTTELTDPNGVYGKTMQDPTATPTKTDRDIFGTADQATITADSQQQHTTPHAPGDLDECDYNVYKWDGKGIENQNETGDFAHKYIKWNQGSAVVTMAAWKAAGNPLGDFWVLDTDGWVYWANLLQPAKSTSNILESVKRERIAPTDFEYYIHIDMQATDIAESELLEVDASTDAKTLITKVKTEDGLFTDNSDGTANYTVVENGAFVEKTTIIGLDGKPGTADDNKIVNPAGKVLKSNVTFSGSVGNRTIALGNGFELTAGADGLIGTEDDLIKGFGNYAQSDDTGTNKDPIDWRLLDIKGNQAVIITDQVLGNVVFNTTTASNEWSGSNLQKWLNETGTAISNSPDFYDTAFTAGEQGKIATTTISATTEEYVTYLNANPIGGMTLVDPPTYGAAGYYKVQVTAPAVNDKVFALSGKEMWDYFGPTKVTGQNPAQLTNGYAKSNAFGIAKGTALGTDIWADYARYWLRSPGQPTTASTGMTDGGVRTTHAVTNPAIGARPALTINL